MLPVRTRRPSAWLLVASCAVAGMASVGRAETAAELVRRSGVEGGLIVHVG